MPAEEGGFAVFDTVGEGFGAVAVFEDGLVGEDNVGHSIHGVRLPSCLVSGFHGSNFATNDSEELDEVFLGLGGLEIGMGVIEDGLEVLCIEEGVEAGDFFLCQRFAFAAWEEDGGEEDCEEGNDFHGGVVVGLITIGNDERSWGEVDEIGGQVAMRAR